MADGEIQIQQPTTTDGNGAALHDAATTTTRSSNSESPSSGGNGSTSHSTSTATSSTFPTTSNSAFTNTASPNPSVPAVIKPIEEPSSSSIANKEDTMKSTSSEGSSVDTFHTPSASLQNLAGSRMVERNKRLSELLDEQNQLYEEEKHLFEEEEEEETTATDTNTVSASIPITVTASPEQPQNDDVISGETEVQSTGQQSQSNYNESRTQQHSSKQSRMQQHKRQNSAGSQCSLSSNPENSQFKTADTHSHSSDSDASRNSTASGIYDNCSSTIGGVIGGEDGDRKSLQSDHSHSGDQLNTSVESVEFGGEAYRGRRSEEHTPRLSGQSVKGASGSSSISTPQGSQVHSSGKSRGKKRMWYQQIFSTSYKTRSGDFKKIFKDLPSKERLIVDYSCALQKEILLQGRMYVSQNYVSFYANIFGWETQQSISFKEIESITKEKTALIIPNAIGITTMTEKFFFSSFVTRDTTYVMLFKLWQSALLEDNITKKELWRLVHTCYGEELGVTSEDESEEMFCPPLVTTTTVSTLIATSDVDGVQSISLNPQKYYSSSPGKTAPEITVDNCEDDFEQDEDDDDDDVCGSPRIGSWEWCRLRGASPLSGLVCAGEIGPAIAVGLNIGSSIVTSNGVPIGTEQGLLKDASIVPIPMLPMTEQSDSSDTEAIIESEVLRKEITSLPIVIPVLDHALDAVESGGESAIPIAPPVCPVDHTNGKEMMNSVIPCNIDQLFTMLFTNSKFYLDFQLSRKTFDINQCEWQLKDGSHKTRQLTFTVLTGQSIGPKTAQVTETQTLLPASRPGLLYAIQSESVNAGIPYADAFSVNCHYCLSRLSSNESNITVISKINYKKSVWAAKPFIEKNSMAALADFFNHLERALKEECAKSIAGSITPTSPVVISSLPRRRHHRKKCRAPDIPASALTRPMIESTIMHHPIGTRSSLQKTAMPDTLSEASAADSLEGSLVMKVVLTVLVCLLLLNAFLYFKLSSLETAANVSVLYPPAIQFSGETPQTHQEWLMLLQQQENLHRSEVQGWHEILVSAIKILHQAEKDLEGLKSHISTYGTSNVVVTPVIKETMDLLQSSAKMQKSDGKPPDISSTEDNSFQSAGNNVENIEVVEAKE